jgi:hypothetical protein
MIDERNGAFGTVRIEVNKETCTDATFSTINPT